jgi:hypothetical protein
MLWRDFSPLDHRLLNFFVSEDDKKTLFYIIFVRLHFNNDIHFNN